MKNFNWEEFKNEKITVHCDTEEKANNFLKECDENNISWVTGLRATDHNNFDTCNDKICYSCRSNGLTYASREFHRKKGTQIINWEVKEMKELTFKEVIANIKEGEVWENKELELKITFKKNEFYIGDSNDNEINGYVGQFINNGLMFKLQRKEYTFEEAFKALEEGKEIESIESHAKYKKIDDCYKTSTIIGEWIFAGCLLNFHEIKGKWYINEVN